MPIVLGIPGIPKMVIMLENINPYINIDFKTITIAAKPEYLKIALQRPKNINIGIEINRETSIAFPPFWDKGSNSPKRK